MSKITRNLYIITIFSLSSVIFCMYFIPNYWQNKQEIQYRVNIQSQSQYEDFSQNKDIAEKLIYSINNNNE